MNSPKNDPPSERSFPLNDKRIINGWAFFDWANSAFSLVITTAIFPAYFTGITDEVIDLLGLKMSNTSLYAYATSFSYLLIALLSPILSGIADYSGKRKFFLRFFTTLGSLACLSLFFFDSMDHLLVGVMGYILSMLGFAGGLVFYNSYLPDIVTEDQYDRVSAKGFTYGYIGSVILLIFNLLLIQFPTFFGLPAEGTLAIRITFVTVGFWWLGFAQISFNRLPDDDRQKPQENLILKGFEELRKVWQKIKQRASMKVFLIAYFFYIAGTLTIIYLAGVFAVGELKFEQTELIITVLLLQILAIGGAYLFAIISDVKGNKFSLIAMLLIWIGICVAGYFVREKIQFYTLAATVGLVMGGIQSLSRSTYSKLIPPKAEDLTSYFSFMDVLEKVAIVSGTFIFGYVEYLTGGMRNSLLFLSLFFIIGLLLLTKVKIEKRKTLK